ncbi:hypothetical protein BO94DRAFT_300618 [Aspergillus sclerotioniger CBS 115572]|uniref:Uncharacterized protein n=1 Tax=Aspergillus sclerotioniger CBS 115572 TaxID=1450535 RepID=A0A317V884_9EURO|nr:hypothetical protein BO94DRAFT_300618 [Aspergillus sclerotioniger CBS 115572]PWY69042.1 hypothetical protein BO94DRAFT_300618 [Aspergillus sclerotioniger CBS 115572]
MVDNGNMITNGLLGYDDLCVRSPGHRHGARQVARPRPANLTLLAAYLRSTNEKNPHDKHHLSHANYHDKQDPLRKLHDIPIVPPMIPFHHRKQRGHASFRCDGFNATSAIMILDEFCETVGERFGAEHQCSAPTGPHQPRRRASSRRGYHQSILLAFSSTFSYHILATHPLITMCQAPG